MNIFLNGLTHVLFEKQLILIFGQLNNILGRCNDAYNSLIYSTGERSSILINGCPGMNALDVLPHVVAPGRGEVAVLAAVGLVGPVHGGRVRLEPGLAAGLVGAVGTGEVQQLPVDRLHVQDEGLLQDGNGHC